MTNKVWLHYSNGNHRGPGVVAKNLIAGLKEIDVEVVDKPGKADLYGCLQDPGRFAEFLPPHTLMGPNLFVLPSEAPALAQFYENYVVPSHWVKDLYSRYPQMQGKTIDVWPVGIDTEEWKPSGETPECDYFVYHKNAPSSVGEEISSVLKDKHGLKSGGWISYGNYQEKDLKEHCKRSKFAVLVTDTESQGIAYMQILSMGIPCFVIDKTTWSYQGNPPTKAPATSVPYFDKRCGVKVASRGMLGMSDEDNVELANFVKKVDEDSYSPRMYILETHTLARSAYEYLRLLKKAAK